MHVDVYASNEDNTSATEELLALLRQGGISERPSIAIGTIICHVGWGFREAFLEALSLWKNGRTGRKAKPESFRFAGVEGDNTTVTISIYSSQAATS